MRRSQQGSHYCSSVSRGSGAHGTNARRHHQHYGEDERALTNLVRMALQYEGWEIDVAHDAREAVDKYRANMVMVVLLTVGVLSVITLRSSLSGVIDTQLTASADGFSYSVTKFRITPTASGGKPPPGAMKPLTQVVGQAPGNVIALIQHGKVVDSALLPRR